MTTGDRARAMARRLELAAAKAGIAEAALPVLRHALLCSLEKRTTRFRDPRHAAFLHPARTALVLLHDTDLSDPDALAAALLIDSVDTELGFDPAAAHQLAGERAAKLVAEVPIPSIACEDLLEALITASEPALLVALAERLDHARHLHLRPTEEWPGFHDQVRRIYAPVAKRAHPTLARRYAWWSGMFGRRYLGFDE